MVALYLASRDAYLMMQLSALSVSSHKPDLKVVLLSRECNSKYINLAATHTRHTVPYDLLLFMHSCVSIR